MGLSFDFFSFAFLPGGFDTAMWHVSLSKRFYFSITELFIKTHTQAGNAFMISMNERNIYKRVPVYSTYFVLVITMDNAVHKKVV